MSVVVIFKCDTCGKTGPGVYTDRVCPDPPLGWVWQFGAGYKESPHACSAACWEPLSRAADGRIRLSYSHEDREASIIPTQPRQEIRIEPEPRKPRKPYTRKAPLLTARVATLETRVDKIEQQL